MGMSNTEGVQVILETAVAAARPNEKFTVAREILALFEEHFDYDCTYELIDHDVLAIRTAALELAGDDEDS